MAGKIRFSQEDRRSALRTPFRLLPRWSACPAEAEMFLPWFTSGDSSSLSLTPTNHEHLPSRSGLKPFLVAIIESCKLILFVLSRSVFRSFAQGSNWNGVARKIYNEMNRFLPKSDSKRPRDDMDDSSRRRQLRQVVTKGQL